MKVLLQMAHFISLQYGQVNFPNHRSWIFFVIKIKCVTPTKSIFQNNHNMFFSLFIYVWC